MRLSECRKTTKAGHVFEGHGEPGTDNRDRTGFSLAKEILIKQGYEIGTLSLLTQATVPDQTAILAIVGPRKPLTTDELNRIHDYVEKGGRLLLMVDPDTQADFTALLSQWGVDWAVACSLICRTGWPKETSPPCWS